MRSTHSSQRSTSRSFKAALGAIAITLVPLPASAQEVVAGPALLPYEEDGWAYSGIEFQAIQNVTLDSFVFNNQGKADTILLLDAGWSTLYSLVTPSGMPLNTIDVDWLLTGGETYRLIRTTSNNTFYGNYGQTLPSNDHIAITYSGLFTQSLGTIGCCGTNTYWSSFTDITTVAAIPEPSTWAMMLLGFGGIGYSMRRRRKTAIAQLA